MRSLLILTTLLASSHCFGFEAQIKNNKGYKILEVRNLIIQNLKISQKLESGLKTEMLILAFAKGKKKEYLLSKVLIKMKYNLWDENYAFQKDSNKPKILSSKEKVISALKNFEMTVLGSNYSKITEDSYRIILKVLVNPIQKEKSKKIKKWLAEKNVSKPNGSGGQIGLTSVFNGMVNRVVLNDLNQDIYGAAQTAEYKSANSLKKIGAL